MNGWVKLHRKILQNQQLDNDRTARGLFIDLMLVCDRNGEWDGGRYQLSRICKLNANTTKGALNRLKKYGIVTTKRHQHYSTISICNWKDYQSSTPLAKTTRKTTRSDFRDHSNKNVATKNKEGELAAETPLASTRSFKAEYERLRKANAKSPPA